MTTKTFNSTISQILQDDSSVEYVDSRENPISTIQTSELIFGHTHNGVECAVCPTAKRACDRAWVTAKQIENWSEMSKMTLWRWLERIEKARRIQSVSDMIQIKIDDENGRGHETKLYNLNVLNQLAMACIDNEKLNEVSCKFSDILSEVETTGSYVATKQPTIYDYARALIAEKERNDALEAQNKALTAERDEAVRTKAMIGSRREATAMATASAKARECEKLREQIGDSETYKRATAIPWLSKYFDTRNEGLYNSLAAQLKKVEASMPPEFAHKPTPDSRFGSVKAYHVAVIEKFHEIVREKLPVDKKFMAKYRKDASSQSENV